MDVINGYRVLGRLGRGGTASVFHVQDAQGRDLALKLLRAAFSVNHAARFRREVTALTRLAHPNVLQVVDSGLANGRPYLVTPLVRGGSLQDRLDRGGPLPLGEARRLVEALGATLSYVHSQGLLHRDLKPDNVLLTPGGAPLLADFGLCLDEEEEAPRLSQTGMLQGTPGYWAPEQAKGQKAQIGVTTDVWGLGAVLYATLTARPPMTTASYAAAALAANRPVPAASDTRAEIPPALDRICARCLAINPEERYASVDEVCEALASVGNPSPGQRGGALPVWAGLLAGLALAGCMGAGFLVWQGTSAAPRREPSGVVPPADSQPKPASELNRLVLQPGPLLGKDSFVSSIESERDDNFGNRGLRIGSFRSNQGRVRHHGLIAWSLERLPRQVEVEFAELRLFVGAPGPGAVFVAPVLPGELWEEGTGGSVGPADGVTWDTCPKADTRFTKRQPRGAGGWLSWNVTDWVQAARQDGRDLSLLLWGDEACQRIDFGSSESVNADERPMLRIDYRGPPAAPDAEAELERKAEAVAMQLIRRAKGETAEVAYELACSALRAAPHLVKAHLMRAQAALDLPLNGLAGIQTAARDLTRARQLGLDPADCPLARLASYRAWKSYADRRTSRKAQAAMLYVFLLASAELESTPTDRVDEALVRRALGLLAELSAVDQAESVVAAAKLWGDEAMASHRAAVRGRLLKSASSLSISRAATVYVARWPDPEVEALVLR